MPLAVAAAAAIGLTACSAGAHAPLGQQRLSLQSTNPASELAMAPVQGVGKALVDGQGMTVYLFVPDHSQGPRCTGLCLAEWPPLLASPAGPPPKAGPGVRQALIGTVTLPDHSRQVTYGGWPLYLWAGDTAPGQANGEGINNFGGPWYTLSASGAPEQERIGL